MIWLPKNLKLSRVSQTEELLDDVQQITESVTNSQGLLFKKWTLLQLNAELVKLLLFFKIQQMGKIKF